MKPSPTGFDADDALSMEAGRERFDDRCQADGAIVAGGRALEGAQHPSPTFQKLRAWPSGICTSEPSGSPIKASCRYTRAPDASASALLNYLIVPIRGTGAS
ncbi:hypothetical protein WH297_24605 [Ochrobactrum vermis]|uniref:Bacterial bifunctional deaminase-reductase C-terminal domain-containing protein n=1 Tax=Ochrobactrum vermis TaxID=1827297 RepID=A0ABU8PLK3_9HYPH|nr:hypothetical protein [Ochrobactrum vermis]